MDLLHVDVFLKGTATKMTFNLKKEQEEGIQFVITSSQCVDCPSYASLYLGSASSGQGESGGCAYRMPINSCGHHDAQQWHNDCLLFPGLL